MGFFSKYSQSYDDGKKMLKEGEYKLAIYEFDKCMETHGYDSYILQLKAFCLMQLEEYDQAIDCYEIILGEYNYDLDRMVLNGIGIAYNKINKPDKALEYFDEGIKNYPDSIDFWINKGVSLIDLEKYEEALECYEEALNLDFSNNAANEGYNYLCEKLGIEGKDFFDPNKVFNNEDPVIGLSPSFNQAEISVSKNRAYEVNDDIFLDNVSEDDLDKLHFEGDMVSEDDLTIDDSIDGDVVFEDDLDKLHTDNEVLEKESDIEDNNEPLEGFVFCQSCGAKLKDDDIFCYKCGAKLNHYVFCKNCGTKLKVGDVFCKNCGTKL